MSEGRLIGVIDPFTNGASGTAVLPGSKSITNRAVLCAALATGRSTLDGVLFADDTEAMIDAVTALGATVRINRGKRRLIIDGIGGRREPPPAAAGEPISVHARSSGTTARFMLPVVAALGGRWLVDGDPQLRARPLDDLLEAQRSLGVEVRELGECGCLPIEVSSAVAGDDGTLPHVRIRADTSSQFATGLLLAGPLRGGMHVEIDAAFDTVSRPYIDMTVAVMEAFGANVDVPSSDSYVVTEGGYRSAHYLIEPDASAASYVWAAAALCGGHVRVDGLGSRSIQGDVRFADVLAEMGADVVISDDAITVGAPPDGALRAGTFDLRDFSDTAQTLAAVAAFAEGTTSICGIGFIRRKETDRIANTATELAKRGVDATPELDGITVCANPFGLRAGLVDCHGDHRMAMAMSLIGLRVAGIDIDDPYCVAKTFPDFYDVLETLRGPSDSVAAPDVRVIAIDGPAASGKSSVARTVAAELAMDYLDTGAMYRAVAWAALRAGVDPDDLETVARIARTAEIEITSVSETQRVTVDGADATAAIRSPEVDRSVSVVAANPQVRRVLVERQREWARQVGGGVMEGRDIGSVVFPEAVLKVFLTASTTERARRRLAQQNDTAPDADHAMPDDEAVAALAAELTERDGLDSGRVDSPLRVAPGAVIVDTSELSQDEAVETITAMYRRAADTAAADPDLSRRQ